MKRRTGVVMAATVRSHNILRLELNLVRSDKARPRLDLDSVDGLDSGDIKYGTELIIIRS